MIILKKPIITEKTLNDYATEKKVTFEVVENANKINAAKALEEVYGVTVEKVWVVNRLGKKKTDRLTRKIVQKSANKKLMTFKLQAKDKIDIFEQ